MKKAFCLSISLLFLHFYTNAQTTEFYGNASSIIASGVIIPKDSKMLWSSGVVSAIIDSTAKEGSVERFGNTKAQAINILENFKKTLSSKGLSMKNIIMLRVYVAPDKWQNGTYDFKGWNEAYGMYFNNKENPVKTIRSTIGVATLVSTEKLIEIEMVAVYPQ